MILNKLTFLGLPNFPAFLAAKVHLPVCRLVWIAMSFLA